MVYVMNFNINGKWMYMELTEDEEMKSMAEHKTITIKVMNECLRDAKELCDSDDIDVTKVASELFQSRCPTLYGFMQGKLWDKIKKVSDNFFDMGAYLVIKEKMRGD